MAVGRHLEISNHHISTMGHPIHLIFGSREVFSGLADRTSYLYKSKMTVIITPNKNTGVRVSFCPQN